LSTSRRDTATCHRVRQAHQFSRQRHWSHLYQDWNKFGCGVDEKAIRENADAVESWAHTSAMTSGTVGAWVPGHAAKMFLESPH
jgi:hypothetical protein